MKDIFRQQSVALFLFFLLFSLSTNARAAWTGKVAGIADGDTIAVFRGTEKIKIRLYGVDAPEKRQAFGNRAKKYTNAVVREKSVSVVPLTQDKYGRVVALVYVEGESLNEALIRDGFAWVYEKYCNEAFCRGWLDLEVSARNEKKGLWADTNPVPPWEWRKESIRQKSWWEELFK